MPGQPQGFHWVVILPFHALSIFSQHGEVLVRTKTTQDDQKVCKYCVCACLSWKRGYFMIDEHSPSEKRCWQTKHHHGNSQGWRRRVCLWRSGGEMDIGRRNGEGARDPFRGSVPLAVLTQPLLSIPSRLPHGSFVAVLWMKGCEENKHWI